MLRTRIHKLSNIAAIYSKAAGGGGGASVNAIFGSDNGGIVTAPWTSSSFTFTTGLAVVGIVSGRSGGFTAITTVTIKGVSATQVGITKGGTGEFDCTLWQASVTSGSGTVVIDTGTGNLSTTCLCGWMLTGLGSTTATATLSTDNATSSHADPQALGTLVVNSGGVGVTFIGADFKDGTQNPTTWVNATADAITNDGTGINVAIAGAHVSGAGSYAITASAKAGATGGDWNFNAMQGAAWA